MRKADDGGGAETGILKPEPDVSEHQYERYDNCIKSSGLHLRTDRGTDRLGCDVVLVNSKLILQSYCKRGTLRLVELLCLEDHFAAARDLLYLRVRVACRLCDDRDDLLIDLIESHILVECDVGRSSAYEVKAVIQGSLACRCVEGHTGKSREDHDAGDRKDDLSLAYKLDELGLSSLAVQLLILCAQRIEDVHEKPCHEQGCEHGYDDTDRQSVSEALDRA